MTYVCKRHNVKKFESVISLDQQLICKDQVSPSQHSLFARCTTGGQNIFYFTVLLFTTLYLGMIIRNTLHNYSGAGTTLAGAPCHRPNHPCSSQPLVGKSDRGDLFCTVKIFCLLSVVPSSKCNYSLPSREKCERGQLKQWG